MKQKFTLGTTYDSPEKRTAGDFLSAVSGLSPERVDDALRKGALWFQRRGSKRIRLREAATYLHQGDKLEFNYDEALLGKVPSAAGLVKDEKRYSVWHKPAGLLTQGTRYGDHCSLLRQVELFFHPPRPVFPVHRLDREAAGLVLICHDRKAAGAFSTLMGTGAISKEYRLEVRGDLGKDRKEGVINTPLDGKAAVTEFTVIAYNGERNTAEVKVTLKTGRLHQIRRHFEMIGFPVMGDPRYGSKNKNREGLRLEACYLGFECPLTGQWREYGTEDKG